MSTADLLEDLHPGLEHKEKEKTHIPLVKRYLIK